MIQLVRYAFMITRRPWSFRRDPFGVTTTTFRVMPWDCDFNLHLTNTRYPMWLDLCRVQSFFEIGMIPLVFKQGWRSVIASQTMSFIREIKPFAKVVVEGRVVYWDHKYVYSEHRFLVDGKLHCKTLARVAMIRGNRVRSFDSLLKAIDVYNDEPEGNYEAMTPSAEITAKINLLNAKRDAELAH
jgi:acyl-CoA thioesterase FadM